MKMQMDNEKSKNDGEFDLGVKNPKHTMPEINAFSVQLDIQKTITITRDCSMLSPWMQYDQIFSRYKVKRPLYLFDTLKYTQLHVLLMKYINITMMKLIKLKLMDLSRAMIV